MIWAGSDKIVLGYSQSEISYDVLNKFFIHHGIQEPCLLGNVMLLPSNLAEIFCKTFGIIFLNKISNEMCEWCEENIKSFYSIHGDEECISQPYIIIQNPDERIIFKLMWI
jgi:hypothetical protein